MHFNRHQNDTYAGHEYMTYTTGEDIARAGSIVSYMSMGRYGWARERPAPYRFGGPRFTWLSNSTNFAAWIEHFRREPN